MESANKYFKEQNYNEAIKIYTELLVKDEFNVSALSNRTVAYLKLNNYKDALKDAVGSTKLEPNSAKLWGRLGASLYGLALKELSDNNLSENTAFVRLQEARQAYNKAEELEPLEIYTKMIKQLDITLQSREKLKSKFADTNKLEDINMNDLLSSICNEMTTNTVIMDKMSDPTFINKIFSMQSNPLAALYDEEIMTMFNNVINNINI